MSRQATVDVGIEAFIRCAPWSPLSVRRQTNSLVYCGKDEEKRFFEPIKSLRDFGVLNDNIDSVCEHLRTFKGTEMAKRVFRNARHWKKSKHLNLVSAVDLSIGVERRNYQVYKAKRIFKGFLLIFLGLCKKLIGNDKRLERQLKKTFMDVFKGLPINFTLKPSKKGQKRKQYIVYAINVVYVPHENLTQHYRAMTKDLNFLCHRGQPGMNELEMPVVDGESSHESRQSLQYAERSIKRKSASVESETTRPLKFVRIEHEQSSAHSSDYFDTPPVSPDRSTHEKAFDFNEVIVISDDEEQSDQPASNFSHTESRSNDEEHGDQTVLEEIFSQVDPNVLSQFKQEQEDVEVGHSDELAPSSSSSSEDNLDQERLMPQDTSGVSTEEATGVNIPQPPGTTAACHTPDTHPTDKIVTADTTVSADSIPTQSFFDPEMEREILTRAWKTPDVRRTVIYLYAKLMEECSKKM